jgi:hypothetical protein
MLSVLKPEGQLILTAGKDEVVYKVCDKLGVNYNPCPLEIPGAPENMAYIITK